MLGNLDVCCAKGGGGVDHMTHPRITQLSDTSWLIEALDGWTSPPQMSKKKREEGRNKNVYVFMYGSRSGSQTRKPTNVHNLIIKGKSQTYVWDARYK